VNNYIAINGPTNAKKDDKVQWVDRMRLLLFEYILSVELSICLMVEE